MVGHHDRTGLDESAPAKSWNSSHQSRGCSQDALKGTGGARAVLLLRGELTVVKGRARDASGQRLAHRHIHSTAAIATAAGSAWMNRILREAVNAP